MAFVLSLWNQIVESFNQNGFLYKKFIVSHGIDQVVGPQKQRIACDKMLQQFMKI